MGKTLYFDCSSGISGDMTLGALLGLTEDNEGFLRELAKLGLQGYEIVFETVERHAVKANHVKVMVTETENAGHAHDHGTHDGIHDHGTHDHGIHDHGTHDHGIHDGVHDHGTHTHRSFRDIRAMIEHSALDSEVKDLALRIFTRVARAEAKVHGKSIEKVQFHEVGAVDSIVDIVGCAILICRLAPDCVCSSVIHDGHGFIHCQHGLLSVPVPAVSEIFADAGMTMCQIDIETELVTPTGAAIIAELVSAYGKTAPGTMPQMKIGKIGWGAGTKVLPIPNLLKVFEGSTEPAKERCAAPWADAEKLQMHDRMADWGEDTVTVLETNLDDCTGEMLGFAMERLLEAGALDVFYTPIFMKKNRPAYLFCVIARQEDAGRMEALMFSHTTTIGIRRRTEHRSILKREKGTVQTPFGELTVKKVLTPEGVRVYPEYESAVILAKKKQRSLWEIYQSYESMGADVPTGI